ncbi:MAG: pilin [bacterium]
MKKVIIQLSLLSCLCLVAVGANAQQQQTKSVPLLSNQAVEQIDKWSDSVAETNYSAQTNKDSMTQIVADVIKVFLGLLGVIFVIIIVWAGYNWMRAGGNEDKVEKAKNLISRSIIGLLIIVAAYAITYWIFARLPY